MTRDFGLINVPIERAVAELISWHDSIGITYQRRECSGSFAEALKMLPPLSMERRRRLFVGTRSDWTACFQSGIDGSDPVPAMSFLSQRLGVLAMRVCSTESGALWAANIWEVFAPSSLGGVPPLGYRRAIGSMNDGGRWSFVDEGDRYPFERVDLYESTRKRDRFSRAVLADYLAALGLAPFDDQFYVVSDDSPAVILDSEQRWGRPAPEFTLADVKAGKPWSRT